MRRLEAKHALITGAGAGIGRSIAVLFAQEGARVAVVDRDGRRAEDTRRAIEAGGGISLAFTADVSRSAAVEELLDRIREHWGALDILVNNAGLAIRRSFARMREAQWDEVLATNLKGAVLCTQKALPLLRRQRGSKVVNIASVEVFRHGRKLSAYAASKGALASLSRSLAVELAPDGIHVNYICPGFIRTEMTRRYAERWIARKIVEHRTPLGRLGEPEDVARVALFLASSDSDFVTGEGIVVDGGLTLRAL
jgi:NAD(P)-dependent dehydrogenase (short-subunit alcohol dehydrogenase family)